MHDALAFQRAHAPGSKPICDLDLESGMCAARNAKGQHFRTMGRGDREGRVQLRPEETLYLLERGSLELRLKGKGRERDGVVLGLQAAYALLMGQEGLTLERFQVYAGLKRSGYIVMRAPEWEGREWRRRMGTSAGGDDGPRGYLSWLQSLLAGMTSFQPRPMVAVGLYRSYGKSWGTGHKQRKVLIDSTADIYSQLPKIQRTCPMSDQDHLSPPHIPSRSLVTVCYHIWKPNPTFKKSAPGEPDFKVAVVPAGIETNEILSPAQLDDLLASIGPRPPPTSMVNHMYQRLQHGQKHVILAIVDQGVVSYLRVADADFGKELLYLSKPPRKGGKRSGGGKGKPMPAR